MKNYTTEYETDIDGQTFTVECEYIYATGEAVVTFWNEEGEEVEVDWLEEAIAQDTLEEAACDRY